MVRQFLVATLLVIFCCNKTLSQTSTYVTENTKQTLSWNDMLGSIVELDGLAWGGREKGLGAHIVMPNNKVYLKDLDLLETELNGRLVRVAGILRKALREETHNTQLTKQARLNRQPIEYYYLDTIAASNIDQVILDQLLPSKSAWIVPGQSAQTAAKLIADRGLQPYLLALTRSNDGSKTRSFLVSNGIVVVYRILNDRVISVSQINLNGVGKLDDEWIELRGFPLPPLMEPSNLAIKSDIENTIKPQFYSDGADYNRITNWLTESTARIRLDAHSGIDWNGESKETIDQLVNSMKSVTDKNVVVISTGKVFWSKEDEYISRILEAAKAFGYNKSIVIEDHSAGILVRKMVTHGD